MEIIDSQYIQAKSLLGYLEEAGEISLFSYAEPNLTKNFLLQCASFHEDKIMEILKLFADRSPDKRLTNFVKQFNLERNYFKLIQTEKNNINAFLSFFGQEFKEECRAEINADELLENGIKAFIEITNLRALIHKNLAVFSLDKTIDEVYALHNCAMIFIRYLENKLLS